MTMPEPEVSAAETLRAAAARLRGGAPVETPTLTGEFPDLDGAMAALLDAHAFRMEIDPDGMTQSDSAALTLARQVLGEVAGRGE